MTLPAPCRVSLVALFLVAASSLNAWGDEPGDERDISTESWPVVTGNMDAMLRSVLSIELPHATGEQPAATTVRPRGAGAVIYPQVAPAIALISTQTGHGTGFFISADGWILTNAHVVEGTSYSHQHQGHVVSVLTGHLGADGWMVESKPPLRATVYRVSERRDLALLKLNEFPTGSQAMPYLRLAKNRPRPGSDCVAIGHPGIGALWSVREGQVTGSGRFPADQSRVIASILSLSAVDKGMLEKELAADSRQKRVIQTNCNISGGDSGGPLVNSDGEVIAVTFAIRSAETVGSLSLHVHLDEVREFIQDLPESPDVLVPSAYPPVESVMRPIDTNGDGKPNAMMLLNAVSGEPVGLQIHLSEGSAKSQREIRKINKLSQSRVENWQPHFSIYSMPTLTILYDRNGDGQFDLVFRDENGNGEIDTKYVLTKGTWAVEATQEAGISSRHFTAPSLSNAFEEWRGEISGLFKQWAATQPSKE